MSLAPMLKKKMFIFCERELYVRLKGFTRGFLRSVVLEIFALETIIGPSISAGLWVMLAWNLAEQSPDEEDRAVKIHVPCTGNFSS